MPCSCGNTTCACGIPCYCSEESCKCPACEIALHRFCKICNKPLITDMQTDKETCSCFVGEPKDFINRDNPECRMGNIPMPLGYFAYGKLIANVVIPVPVLHLPHLINQRPISLMLPSSIQKDSGNISPVLISNTDVATPISPEKNSGIPPLEGLHQLYQSSGLANCRASSCVSSTCAQNTAISCKETVPSLVLQSADERQTAHMMQNTRLEREGCTAVQEASRFFPPSMRFDNITDPVGRLSNSALCVADCPESSRELCNSFCKARSVHTMTNSEKESRKPAPSLNFDLNNSAQGDSATITRMDEQPLGPTRMTGKSGLEFHGKHEECEDSLSIATNKEFTVFPSPGNSNDIASTEQCASNSLRSNEGSEISTMHDGTSVDVSTNISVSRMQEFINVHSQPVCAVATTGGHNDHLQTGPVACGVAESVSDVLSWKVTNFKCQHQTPSNTEAVPGYLGASKFEPVFNKSDARSSKANENLQSGNPSSASESRRNEVNDPIPLYIDTSTTQKMEKLLKSVKRSNVTSPFCR